MRGESPTRVRIIEAAEALIAERGVNGVSLREIGAAAGQRNTAAARYHFASKAGLVDAVFRYRMAPINERRLAMLAEIDRAGRGHDHRALTEAFLVPLSEVLGDASHPSSYLRFCVHAAYVIDTTVADLGAQPWTQGVATIKARLDELLGDLAPAARRDRWELYAGYVTHALAHRELLLANGQGHDLSDRHAFSANLIDTAVALVTAPATSEVPA